jgi:predicted nuclease with TOPRIM domain
MESKEALTERYEALQTELEGHQLDIERLQGGINVIRERCYQIYKEQTELVRKIRELNK